VSMTTLSIRHIRNRRHYALTNAIDAYNHEGLFA
jgi:hypothetical protein